MIRWVNVTQGLSTPTGAHSISVRRRTASDHPPPRERLQSAACEHPSCLLRTPHDGSSSDLAIGLPIKDETTLILPTVHLAQVNELDQPSLGSTYNAEV